MERTFPCPHCGVHNPCADWFAKMHAGRRITRWCASCRRLFDVDLPPHPTLGELLFANPLAAAVPEREWHALVHAVGTERTEGLYGLYDRMHRIIFILMLRVTGDWETAEDLTLDVFQDVWQRAGTYTPGDASVISWVLQQARSRWMARRDVERSAGRSTGSWVDWPMDRLPAVRASLQARLAQRIANGRAPATVPMTRPAPSPDWQEVGTGISYTVLARDLERERVSLLVRLAQGAAYPPHTHAGVEELYLLDGELWIDQKKVHPGEYNRADAGSSDQRVWSETGCTCVLLTSTADILR
jgi:DNA-directed RNA polymerase specialized sigma24 family protein